MPAGGGLCQNDLAVDSAFVNGGESAGQSHQKERQVYNYYNVYFCGGIGEKLGMPVYLICFLPMENVSPI